MISLIKNKLKSYVFIFKYESTFSIIFDLSSDFYSGNIIYKMINCENKFQQLSYEFIIIHTNSCPKWSKLDGL